MPLVTLTCSKRFYPPDEDPTDDLHSFDQGIVIQLTDLFPRLIVDNATILGLDLSETPEEGVQVDVKKFHSRSRNAVDLWIQIQFVEPYPGEEKADSVRKILHEIFAGELDTLHFDAEWALDIGWGPIHGCLSSGPHEVKIAW